MKTSPKSLKVSTVRGFTLIELLVVVSIIVILAGLTVGVAGFVQRKSSLAKASTQMKLLENGIENYKHDAGSYPEFESEDGMILYKMLYGDGIGPDFLAGTEDDTEPDGQADDGATVYLPELDPLNNPMKLVLVISGNPRKVVDPWAGPWNYLGGERYKSTMNNPDFDLWSYGPDTKKNTGDEVKNW